MGDIDSLLMKNSQNSMYIVMSHKIHKKHTKKILPNFLKSEYLKIVYFGVWPINRLSLIFFTVKIYPA